MPNTKPSERITEMVENSGDLSGLLIGLINLSKSILDQHHTELAALRKEVEELKKPGVTWEAVCSLCEHGGVGNCPFHFTP